MAPTQPEQKHEPVRIAPNIGQPDHGVRGPGQQQRHQGHARQHLHPLAPPQRMHQLEAGHPRRLIEEAHRRMLTRDSATTNLRGGPSPRFSEDVLGWLDRLGGVVM
jgi:hypothetical protein